MGVGGMIILILMLPLVGGVLSFWFKIRSALISTIGVTLSSILSVTLLFDQANYSFSYEWIPSFALTINVDNVSLLLISLVTFISTLVHIFSTEYMAEDPGKSRYFAKLGFFTFSMIGLLLADNLILLFVFWELVGFASYLLIGFWFLKAGIPASARLAFMVNRMADVALLIGILIFWNDGNLDISEQSSIWSWLPSLLICVGAFGKSAQLPFSGWLTKAMVGPTPVSALIHAATMVAAGVYLLFRVSPFIDPQILTMVAFVGVITALYSATCALFQNDIKKVLAYSTISQLGYMVMGVGLGASDASIFHLFTHAFFKAGLFLGAGSIIHYLHKVTKEDAQDMRNMGGLKAQLPWTYRTFLVCSLALAGLPFFSGFMSKDAILIAGWGWAEKVGTWGYLIPDLGLIIAFLTAFYVGRMVLLVFWGENRLKEHLISMQEKLTIQLPLILLAVGSIWIFYSWNPLSHETWLSSLWSDKTHTSGSGAWIVMGLSILLALAGLALAFAYFKPNSNYVLNYKTLDHNRFKLFTNGLFLVNGYQKIGVGVLKLARVTDLVDRRIFDGFIHFVGVGTVVLSKIIALIDRFLVDGPINLFGYLSSQIGRVLAGFSSRDTQTQLIWLVLAIILILSWILFF